MSAGGSFFDANVPEVVLKSLFQKYDTDGSGKLHSEELSRLLEDDLGLEKSEAQAYALLLDKDGSSGVSFEEFQSWLKSGEKFQMINDSSRFARVKAAVEMFQKYDEDGSQTIGKEEFLKLHTDVGGQPDKADSALAALDKDGNGTISFVEFLKWLNWVPMDSFE